MYPTYQGQVVTTSYVNPNTTTYIVAGAAGVRILYLLLPLLMN